MKMYINTVLKNYQKLSHFQHCYIFVMYFLNVHHVGHFKILISVCHTMLKVQFLSKNKFCVFLDKN